MKTPEEIKQEWIADKKLINDETFEERLTKRIVEIQLDALTQGRKEGREQGIKEALSLHHVLCDKDKEGDFLWHDDDVCSKSILSLLTHPSPKEQEK